MPESKLHQRKRRLNLIMLIALLALVGCFYFIATIRVGGGT
ncbi:MAG: hypothetical protein AAF153_00510 [Pseudomonadota bacterium]